MLSLYSFLLFSSFVSRQKKGLWEEEKENKKEEKEISRTEENISFRSSLRTENVESDEACFLLREYNIMF